MPRAARLPARRAVPQGFTLLELLVVIGIIMLFLGLTIGAVMRTPTVNKLIATEQMMADVVRQARHTARSTGSPVEITISKANRVIMGVSQIPVWNATFDDGDAQYTSYLTNLGQTGSGLWCPPDGSGNPTYPAPVVLTPAQSLARNPNVLDGFYLAAAVNPPDVNGAQDIEPLVQIGNEDDSKCCCGLALWNEATTIQQVSQLTAGTPITAAYSSWDVVGWINDASGYHRVCSIEDSIVTPATYLPSSAMDVAGPIVGNRWEEFGLLYDGHVLELYRNGRVIARNNGPFSGVPAIAAACNGPISIAEGTFSSLPGNFGASPVPKRTLQGTLDNLRLLRLGTDRAASLPSGVTADNDYQLTVRPDGIVENNLSALSNPSNPTSQHTLGATVTFQIMGEVSAGAVSGLDTAVISISSDGSVSSLTNASTVTTPGPAP
jgi:prepilin-type N-terminal cleavage/methylation domain-containing protein